MCKTYNTIGALTTINLKLSESNIDKFQSIIDVVNFGRSYSTNKLQVLSFHKDLIEQETISLQNELSILEETILLTKLQTEQKLKNEIEQLKSLLETLSLINTTNLLQKFIISLKTAIKKRQLTRKENRFEDEIYRSVASQINEQSTKQKRYEQITSNKDEAILLSAQKTLAELDRKKTKLDELKSFIIGAIGEQKVVEELEYLSDDYFLINDFNVTFSPALYNKKENDYIKSIQIDHILVGPSGLFLIETKNWSEKSLENLDLRSPVDQIKRSSFALYKLLHNQVPYYGLQLDYHHWGNKKISIKNLLVLVNAIPKEEFQFVKILNINQLYGYINYFKPTFTNIETKKIADYLLELNNQKIIRTK